MIQWAVVRKSPSIENLDATWFAGTGSNTAGSPMDETLKFNSPTDSDLKQD